MKVIVIIPAAGLGTRMVGAAKDAAKPALSKQFTELGGVPIIIHTLRKFAALPEVDESRTLRCARASRSSSVRDWSRRNLRNRFAWWRAESIVKSRSRARCVR